LGSTLDAAETDAGPRGPTAINARRTSKLMTEARFIYRQPSP